MNNANTPADDPLDDDPSIPVLTDVIGLAPESAATAPRHAGRTLDEAVLAARIRLQVLERLRSPEVGLEQELMEHLAPMLERATRRFAADLTSQLRAALSYVTDSVVERAVDEALAAERDRQGADPLPKL